MFIFTRSKTFSSFETDSQRVKFIFETADVDHAIKVRVHVLFNATRDNALFSFIYLIVCTILCSICFQIPDRDELSIKSKEKAVCFR